MKTRPNILMILVLIVMLVGMKPSPVQAADCTVTNAGGSGAGSLSDLVANSGCSMITFAGDYTITPGGLYIDHNLTIDGAGHHVTLIGSAIELYLGSLNLELKNLTITQSAQVDLSGGNLTVTNTTFLNNITGSSFGGGAISSYSSGNLVIINSIFSGNGAPTHQGGAIYNYGGSVQVYNSTFSGNSADKGGAIYNYGGSVEVYNSTFSGNSAPNGQGGAIYNDVGSVRVYNSTFSGNSAASGGSLANQNGNIRAFNSLFVNATGGNCAGVVYDPYYPSDNNLADDASCGETFTLSSSILLGTLGDYGGSTQTFPLLPGSAAIDAGKSSYCPTTDQRGMARVGACDIGAFEFRPPAVSAPEITAQPQSQGVRVGDAVSFSAAASGVPTPTLQWQARSDSGATWTDLDGATSSPLTFTAAYAQNGYQYRAVFTNVVGSASTDVATLTVSKKTANCNISGWIGAYDGQTHGASGACTGSDGTALTGLNLGATYTNVPGGSAHWIFSGGSDYTDQSGDMVIVITKATATVTLSNLAQTADGSPKPVTVTTVPAGLSVAVTYNGSSTAPSAAGSYAVVATINDNNYQGTASGTLVITAPPAEPYSSTGFTAPVDLGSNVYNSANSGQIIPLKWRLLDGSGSPVTNLNPASVGLTVSATTCPSGALLDTIETYAVGTTTLQNLGNGYYQLNWKTDKAWANSCKQLTLKIGTWTTSGFSALFQFKK